MATRSPPPGGCPAISCSETCRFQPDLDLQPCRENFLLLLAQKGSFGGVGVNQGCLGFVLTLREGGGSGVEPRASVIASRHKKNRMLTAGWTLKCLLVSQSTHPMSPFLTQDRQRKPPLGPPSLVLSHAAVVPSMGHLGRLHMQPLPSVLQLHPRLRVQRLACPFPHHLGWGVPRGGAFQRGLLVLNHGDCCERLLGAGDLRGH